MPLSVGYGVVERPEPSVLEPTELKGEGSPRQKNAPQLNGSGYLAFIASGGSRRATAACWAARRQPRKASMGSRVGLIPDNKTTSLTTFCFLL